VALDSARITAGCITNLLGNTWRNKIRWIFCRWMDPRVTLQLGKLSCMTSLKPREYICNIGHVFSVHDHTVKSLPPTCVILIILKGRSSG
jgi:hypothetical protein